tara:strand:- start:449 stop:1264 length:816 start_codon:yes stop_codon:yes gene_type:complete
MVRLLVLFFSLVALAGCNLNLITTKGGHVVSASGFRDCAPSNVCEFNVGSTFFKETFTAVADPYYEFRGWSNGDGYLCADEPTDTCVIDLSPFAYNLALADVVHSERNAYIVPIFERTEDKYTTPQVIDRNGDIVSTIYEETYGSWAHIDFNGEPWGKFFFGVQWYTPSTSGLYFVGDECNPDLAYSSIVISEWAFFVEMDETHGFRPGNEVESIEVGSRWDDLAGACVDISDQTLAPAMDTDWMGIDTSVKPLTRVGPPSCAVHLTPDCV